MATASDIYIARSSITPSIAFSAYNANKALLTGAINELFAAVSPAQALNGYIDYRLLMVFNANTIDDLDGLKIYVSSQTTSPSTQIQLAVADGYFSSTSPAYTSGPTAPSIPNVTATPSGVIFTDASTFAEALSLGTLPPLVTSSSLNARFVWVKRTVTAGASALASDFGTITVTNRV